MEENNVVNVAENVSTSSSDDGLFLTIFKFLFMVLIGGMIVKAFKKAKNYFSENKRLREKERQEKEQAEFDRRVEEKAQEKLDAMLAAEVKSEEDSTKA